MDTSSLPEAIICDIDGTMANIEHRRRFLQQNPKDWKSFNNSMDGDTLNKWCADLIWALSQEMRWKIIYVTGRHNEFREPTLRLLNHGDLPHDFVLHMRKDGDYRHDHIIKKEIYHEHIEPYYKVQFAIDDRKQVVDLWRSLGLVCLQCDEGNF